MKKETASQKRYTRLHKLVSACIDHFSEDEMMEVFQKLTNKEYMEREDTESLVSTLAIEGYCIFKPDNRNQADKLKEYAETNIFPYYNEQQTAILF